MLVFHRINVRTYFLVKEKTGKDLRSEPGEMRMEEQQQRKSETKAERIQTGIFCMEKIRTVMSSIGRKMHRRLS